MAMIRAVLFDFSDTLFRQRGGHVRLQEAAAALGTEVSETTADDLWDRIQGRSRTPEEMAKGRDLSPQRHRECWTDLYRAADVVTEGMAELLYEQQLDPADWEPYFDAPAVLGELARRNVPVGVVSDVGWDIRSVFAAHGLGSLVATYVLSYEHGMVKPAPGLFAVALGQLGVRPSETLMVGDNPTADGGAASAGITALVLPAVQAGHPRGLGTVLALAGNENIWPR
jgi:putative hydrolase of the HAD superfamily